VRVRGAGPGKWPDADRLSARAVLCLSPELYRRRVGLAHDWLGANEAQRRAWGVPVGGGLSDRGLNAPPAAKATIDGKVGVDINVRGTPGTNVSTSSEGAVGPVKVRRGAMMPKPDDRA
jgi:hypothetical protein